MDPDNNVTWQFPEDPLASLPELTPHPPQNIPYDERLTKERLESMNINEEGFLWEEEEQAETAGTLKDKQYRMEQQVYRIWT